MSPGGVSGDTRGAFPTTLCASVSGIQLMPPPPHSRRCFLRSSLPAGALSIAAAAGLLKPTASHAWFPFFTPAPKPASPSSSEPPPLPSPLPQPPDRVKTRLEVLLDELRLARPETNPGVDLVSPDIAVDGASIMLGFKTLLPDVDGLAVYIEANPQPLAAAFHLAPTVLPEMKLMVRLAKSSNIAIVVRSQGRFYQNSKFVKVTRGGCSDSFEEAESRHRREVQHLYRTSP